MTILQQIQAMGMFSKNINLKQPMPAGVAHGSGLHLLLAVGQGPSSDAWQTYPWLNTSTEPRIKPWVNALNAKCQQPATSPSIETRQGRNAEERAQRWQDFRMFRVPGGMSNVAEVSAPRRDRRALARQQSGVA